MSVLVGRPAPLFKAEAVVNGDFKEVQLSDYKGKKYVCLFFYPLDFTFVCPTELHAFQEKYEEFKKRDVELIGCSIDSKNSHLAWVKTPKSKGGIEGVTYPLVSDIQRTICRDYDVLSGEGIAYRGLFLIDKSGVVRHQLVNDLPLGRNVDEALRMVDALQFNEKNGEVCPANWTQGKEAIKTTTESVAAYLSKK
jgi:peroxiredoxin (alkyl hydroperoxide reductase subunit C)